MFGAPQAHIRVEDADGVTVIRTLVHEIRSPSVAEEVGRELYALIGAGSTNRYLLDLGRTAALSSTAFAVIVTFHKKVAEAGGVLKVCGMDPEVRIGADIIGLGRLVEIFDDEGSALDSF